MSLSAANCETSFCMVLLIRGPMSFIISFG